MRIGECSPLVFRVAYGVLRNREDAEDVTQEAFAKAYKSFAKLRERDRFRAWIVKITWHMALDYQRSHKRRSVRENVHFEITSRTVVPAAEVEPGREARLWNAVDALPEKMRIVLILANVEEYDTQEIASMLGIPEGTVKSRLFHARIRLKELLQ